MIVRKSLLFCCTFLIVSVNFVTSQDDGEEAVNPEDVDDVKPPVEELKNVEIAKQATTPSLLTTTNITEVLTMKNETLEISPSKPAEPEKKDELLTGKEETPSPIPENSTNGAGSTVATSIDAETKIPEVGKDAVNAEDVVDEDNKENAAPEFEAKQEVEGGKGEEDPDANVDKPVQADPPKDEADGAAKEDRESQPIGAEGLHEAVEEARGNPAAGVVVAAEIKKETSVDETDEQQNLDTQPIARPHRLGAKHEFEPMQGQIDESEEGIGFMSFFFVATFLVVFVYVLQHNKKKLLGLMFEGRSSRSSTSSRRNGNVKYRRLSQSDQN